MEKIKLMIADDHSMVREGLIQLLELEEEFEVIAEASNGDECLKLLSDVKPDILLLDINMPNKNGLDVLKCLNNMEEVHIKVLVLTVHNEVDYLVKSMEYGIDGYVLKDSESSELKKAILSIARGEKYIQPSLKPLLEDWKVNMDSDMAKIDSLTKRELDVLKNLSIGMYNKEIATKLEISERTVKNHVFNIFKKIGVADRTQAAVFAIKNNLVNINE